MPLAALLPDDRRVAALGLAVAGAQSLAAVGAGRAVRHGVGLLPQAAPGRAAGPGGQGEGAPVDPAAGLGRLVVRAVAAGLAAALAGRGVVALLPDAGPAGSLLVLVAATLAAAAVGVGVLLGLGGGPAVREAAARLQRLRAGPVEAA